MSTTRLFLLGTFLLVVTTVLNAQNHQIDWSVTNGGFSQGAGSSGTITTALAQHAVGMGRGGNHSVESGFLVYGPDSGGSIMNGTWVQLSGGIPTAIHYSLTTDDSTIYAGNNSSAELRLFRSTDNGNTWAGVTGIPSTGIVWALSNLGGTLFAGTFGSGLYRSTDWGILWTRADSGMSHTNPRGFTRNSSYIFTCTWSGGVYRSTDNGNYWTAASSGITGGGLWPIHAMGNYIFVGGQVGGVFRSSNNGTSWQAVNSGLTNTIAYALASVGTDLFVGTGGSSVFKSTDYGNSWTPANNGMPNSLTVYALLSINTILVAGTATNGVFVSTDRGGSWSAINDGLTNQQVFSLAVNSQYLFAGTSSTVFRRDHGQIMVTVPPAMDERPVAFNLAQNYPNPFNPSTIIPFQIPTAERVVLKVYNILGQEVVTLMDEWKEPGAYEVAWNASGVSSGMYFYRLSAGERSETRKLLLLR